MTRVVSRTEHKKSISLFLPWMSYAAKRLTVLAFEMDCDQVAMGFSGTFRLFAGKVTYLYIIYKRKKLLSLRHMVLVSIPNCYTLYLIHNSYYINHK
jgi:hypothetical protein